MGGAQVECVLRWRLVQPGIWVGAHAFQKEAGVNVRRLGTGDATAIGSGARPFGPVRFSTAL